MISVSLRVRTRQCPGFGGRMGMEIIFDKTGYSHRDSLLREVG